jgi:hypothetical protein
MLEATLSFFNKSDIPSLSNRNLKQKIKIKLSIRDDVDIYVTTLWKLNLF